MRLVEIKDLFNGEREALTSSRQVAKDFDKRHDHVVRDIEDYLYKSEVSPKLGRLKEYFIESEYIDSWNRPQKEYLMTRDGFSFLVMGFTGDKALEWKIRYIEAFNKMEAKLIKERYKTQYLSRQTNLSRTINILHRAQKQGDAELKRVIRIYKDYIPDDIVNLYIHR